MLLRSSSTPVLGSLFSSFSETPNNTTTNNYSNSEVLNTTPHNYSKICYKHNHAAVAAAGTHNLTKSLYNSSPISPSISELSGNNHTDGFRRAQSEGNLEGLVSASSNIDEEFNFSIPTKKFSRRPPHCSTLEAIPSSSFGQNSTSPTEDENSEEEEEEERLPKENGLVYDNFVGMDNLCRLKEDGKYASGYNNINVGEEMYLARGLGVADFNFVDIGGYISGGGGGGGGGEDYRPVAFGGDGGDSNGLIMEEHYKRMLEENPSNPLCLRNYAQFLHQTKKDPQSAEEYYSRAILADPQDGEVLSQYAKLVWELYHDKERATDYFERAVQAASQDSHVQAAYASFLWETDDEAEDEDDQSLKNRPILTLVNEGVTA